MKSRSGGRTMRVALVTLVFCAVNAGVAAGQPQAAGGKLSTEPAATAKPPAKTTTKRSTSTINKTRPSTVSAGRSSGSPANVGGKWWTTGNGFGDSEVIFTQNGADVSGVIRYADGRTGTINGKMVGKRLQHSWINSSGQGGAGWLELSWNNFLGGPWGNQQIRNGSWTLSRIEGNWCFGGNRNRIRKVTHDGRGRS